MDGRSIMRSYPFRYVAARALWAGLVLLFGLAAAWVGAWPR